MSDKKLLFSGVSVLIGSIVLGGFGIIWGIYFSFDALKANETAGLNQVGAGIEYALIFNIIAIVGSVIGLILIIFGIIKSQRNKNLADEKTKISSG